MVELSPLQGFGGEEGVVAKHQAWREPSTPVQGNELLWKHRRPARPAVPIAAAWLARVVGLRFPERTKLGPASWKNPEKTMALTTFLGQAPGETQSGTQRQCAGRFMGFLALELRRHRRRHHKNGNTIHQRVERSRMYGKIQPSCSLGHSQITTTQGSSPSQASSSPHQCLPPSTPRSGIGLSPGTRAPRPLWPPLHKTPHSRPPLHRTTTKIQCG